MSRVILFLLSCSMILAVVVAQIQYVAVHPDQQCLNRGYPASCGVLIRNAGQLDCSNVPCAGQGVQAVWTGPADDGTICNNNKGHCVDLPSNYRILKEEGQHPYDYVC